MKKLHFLFATILVGIALMASSCGSKDAIGPGEKRSDGTSGGSSLNAPTITVAKADTARRFSADSAEIKFTSNQAGKVYYAVVSPYFDVSTVDKDDFIHYGQKMYWCEPDCDKPITQWDTIAAGKKVSKKLELYSGDDSVAVIVVVANNSGLISKPFRIGVSPYRTVIGTLYEISFANKKFTATAVTNDMDVPLKKSKSASRTKKETILSDASIQKVIDAIQKDAWDADKGAGDPVRIQFGDGNAPLNVGATPVNLRTFDKGKKTEVSWGDVALLGSITGNVPMSANAAVLNLDDDVSVTSFAYVSNTAAAETPSAIFLASAAASLKISSGSVSVPNASVGLSVYNGGGGSVSIAGGSVGYTHGVAAYTGGTINVVREAGGQAAEFVTWFAGEGGSKEAIFWDTDVSNVVNDLAPLAQGGGYVTINFGNPNYWGGYVDALYIEDATIEFDGAAWNGGNVSLTGSLTGNTESTNTGVVFITGNVNVSVDGANLLNSSYNTGVGNSIFVGGGFTGAFRLNSGNIESYFGTALRIDAGVTGSFALNGGSIRTSSGAGYAIYSESDILIDYDPTVVSITGNIQAKTLDMRLVLDWPKSWLWESAPDAAQKNSHTYVFAGNGTYVRYDRDADGEWHKVEEQGQYTTEGDWYTEDISGSWGTLVIDGNNYRYSFIGGAGTLQLIDAGGSNWVYSVLDNPAYGDVTPPIVEVINETRTATGVTVTIISSKFAEVKYYVCGEIGTNGCGAVDRVTIWNSNNSTSLGNVGVEPNSGGRLTNVDIPMPPVNTHIIFVAQDKSENHNTSDMAIKDVGIFAPTLVKSGSDESQGRTVSTATLHFTTNEIGEAKYNLWDINGATPLSVKSNESAGQITGLLTETKQVTLTDLYAGDFRIELWLVNAKGNAGLPITYISSGANAQPSINSVVVTNTSRTSNDAATVSVTADDVGQIYYSTVSAAAIVTTGTGIAYTTAGTSQNISITGLGWGTKPVYVVIKSDHNGQISNPFTSDPIVDGFAPAISNVDVEPNPDPFDNEAFVTFTSDEPGKAFLYADGSGTAPTVTTSGWVEHTMVYGNNTFGDGVKILDGDKDIYLYACDGVITSSNQNGNCTSPVKEKTLEDTYAPNLVGDPVITRTSNTAVSIVIKTDEPGSVKFVTTDPAGDKSAFTGTGSTINSPGLSVTINPTLEDDDVAQTVWILLADNHSNDTILAIPIEALDLTPPSYVGSPDGSRTDNLSGVIWFTVDRAAEGYYVVGTPDDITNNTYSSFDAVSSATGAQNITGITADVEKRVDVGLVSGDRIVFLAVKSLQGTPTTNEVLTIEMKDATPPEVSAVTVTAESTAKGTLVIRGVSITNDDDFVNWFWNSAPVFSDMNLLTTGTEGGGNTLYLTTTTAPDNVYGGQIYVFARDEGTGVVLTGNPSSTYATVNVKKWQSVIKSTVNVNVSGGANVTVSISGTDPENVNVSGKIFYVLVDKDAAAPSSAQVVAGQDSNGDPVTFKNPTTEGENIVPGAALTVVTENVTNGEYDVYVVLQGDSDDVYQINSEPVKAEGAIDIQ